MAFFHLKLSAIKRNEGKNLIAAVAYRTGTKMESLYTGETFDYTKKKWITHVELMLPCGVAETRPEYQDIGTFFNAVDLAESKSDARVAIELVIALPHELNLEQQKELAKEFVRHNFTDKGIAALLCMHWPPKHDDIGRALDKNGNPTTDISEMDFESNPHIHLLIPLRTLDKKGNFEPKSYIEYICKKGDVTKAFTAEEFKDAKQMGWEKQYRYKDPRTFKNMWLTPTEAKELGLGNKDRTSKQPKTTPYGRKNEKYKYLSESESLCGWRVSWEECCNRKLYECGIEARIDHRTLEAQGINRMPTLTLGKQLNRMKLRSERLMREGKTNVRISQKAAINQDIREYNDTLQKDEAVTAEIKKRLTQIQKKLSDIREKRSALAIRRKDLSMDLGKIKRLSDEEISEEQRQRESMEIIADMNKKANAMIAVLERELSLVSRLDVPKRKDLQNKINSERQKISDRNQYLETIKKNPENNAKGSDKKDEDRLKNEIDTLQAEMDDLDQMEKDILAQVPNPLRNQIILDVPWQSEAVERSKAYMT